MEADPFHMSFLICARPAPKAGSCQDEMMAVRPTGKSPNVGTFFPGLTITCESTVHMSWIACRSMTLNEFASTLGSAKTVFYG